MAHRFKAENLERLDSPVRRLLQPPKRTLVELGIAKGDRFIDIGAGSGFFALPACELVGTTGEVFAVDIQPAAIAILERKRKEQRRDNLSPVLSNEDSLNLPDGVGNFAFMYTVLHEVEDKPAMLMNLFRALSPGGKIAIVEFREKACIGPPPQEKIKETEMLKLLASAGFHDATLGRRGLLHYVAIANKPCK